jgi:hypothetical protein
MIPVCCPICGRIPTFITVDLDRGNGHGYPGEFSYHYECSHCKMVQASGSDTMITHGDKEKAKQKAIESWNERVKMVQQYLSYTKKPLTPLAAYQKLIVNLTSQKFVPENKLLMQIVEKALYDMEESDESN